jgi:hypothetical protein
MWRQQQGEPGARKAERFSLLGPVVSSEPPDHDRRFADERSWVLETLTGTRWNWLDGVGIQRVVYIKYALDRRSTGPYGLGQPPVDLIEALFEH